MINNLIILLCTLASISACASPDYSPLVKSEFQKFFGEPVPEVIQSQKVDLATAKVAEMPEQIPVTMRFDIKGVERVLLLKVPSNGYSRDGLHYTACEQEPVYIAGYTINANANLSEMETRISTQCIAHQVILMMWVKTNQGYYLDTESFQTSAESPGM